MIANLHISFKHLLAGSHRSTLLSWRPFSLVHGATAPSRTFSGRWPSLLLWLCFSAFINAQDGAYIYQSTDYTTDDGLASRFTNFTHKDTRGIVWVGTQQGLHRFDGRNFKVFNESSGLPFNEVMEIYEGPTGWLWLFRSCHNKDKEYCFKDLAFFHPNTHEVRTFAERFGNDPPFLPADIEFITTSPSRKRLVAVTSHNTFALAPDGQLKRLPLNGHGERYDVFSILDDGRMAAAESLNKHILAFREQQKEHQQLKQLNTKDILEKLKPKAPTDMLILSENGSVLETMALPDSLRQFFKFPVSSYSEGISNGRRDSFFYLGESAKLLPQFFPNGFNFDNYRHFHLDRPYRMLWLADRFGLQVVNFEKKRFNGFRAVDKRWLLQDISPTSDHVVVYANGFYDFKHHTNHWIGNHIEFQGYYPAFTGPEILEAKQFHLLREDLMIEDKNGQIKSIPVKRFSDLRFNAVTSYQKFGGIYWFGTSTGLWSYDAEKDAFAHFRQAGAFTDFNDCFVHEIQPCSEGRYWIATNKGLFLWSARAGVVAQYGNRQEGRHFIPSDNIYHFYQKADDELWLASRDGLVHLALDSSQVFEDGNHYRFFTEENGLLNHICVAVYADGYGFLWVATGKGLVQLDTATSHFKVHTKRDGMAVDYFREYNHYQAPSGELVFGGIDGIVSFHPKDFKDENVAPPEVPLVVVECEYYNPATEKFELFTDRFLRQGSVTLSPDIQIFSMRVALADFRNAKEQRYAYRIEGYQGEWREDPSNVVRVSGLPYGDHRLEIKGRLADGRFSADVLSIPIKVLRPYYQQPWFVVLAVLGAFGGISLFFKYRTQNLRKTQQLLQTEIAKATDRIQRDKQTIEAQASELKELDKMKSRFFANISHELRTPLTLVLAPIQHILKRNQLANQDYTQLLLAERNTQRLGKLVNQILDLSKLESGKLEINNATVAWYVFLKNITANFESLANIQDIHFRFVYEGNQHLQVEIDREKTEIVLLNLLSNAFKFTPQGGQVTLSAKDKAQFLQVVVEDTGRGIPPDDLPHIFDRFFQTNNKNAPAEGGTGIGLALTQEFVRLMGGTISVKSGVGEGTVFILEIPRKEIIRQMDTGTALLVEDKMAVDRAVNALPKSPDQSPKSPSPDRPTILLTEDNYDLRYFIKSILSKKYSVVTAENGAVAFEYLQAPENQFTIHHLPFAIVSDIMMPIMDGYQLLDKVKNDPALRHIPVIMLTARAAMDDRLKALRLGVDGYLNKPFNQEELMARIENLLKNAAIRRSALAEIGLEMQGDGDRQETPGPFDQKTQEWLDELEKQVMGQLDNFSYTTEQLAADLHLSKRQLLRRLNATIGLSPSQYVKTVRLTKARALFEEGKATSVKEVAFSVGYKDVAYFSKQFKEAYGRLPSDLLD